jgi:hypothetical protein
LPLQIHYIYIHRLLTEERNEVNTKAKGWGHRMDGWMRVVSFRKLYRKSSFRKFVPIITNLRETQCQI